MNKNDYIKKNQSSGGKEMVLTREELDQFGKTFISKHQIEGYEINLPGLKGKFYPKQISYEKTDASDLELLGEFIGKGKFKDKWEDVTDDNASMLLNLTKSENKEIKEVLEDIKLSKFHELHTSHHLSS